ncbi:MAG: hypothetical protein ABEJ72_01665, partial [Candidatus Aenigmatarchaeota archaeon]
KEELGHSEDVELGNRVAELGDIGFINSTKVATSARRVDDWGYFKLWYFCIVSFLYLHLFGQIYDIEYF